MDYSEAEESLYVPLQFDIHSLDVRSSLEGSAVHQLNVVKNPIALLQHVQS